MLLKIFPLLLISVSSFGQSPQMPTEVFKASWKSLETQLGTVPLCHESIEKLLTQEGMSTSISCVVKCSDGNQKLYDLKRNFLPSEQGMRKGDGNLWASLSTTLKYWSEESCFHFAAEECQGLNKIEAVETQGLKSGDWTFSGQVSCGKNQKIIYSPFDSKIKTQGLNQEEKNIPAKNRELLSLSSDWRRPFGMSTREKQAPIKDCVKKVSATFCYGDCISLTGELHREFLASPAPLGSDQYEFCMDSLFERVKKKSLPRSILTHLCETEILASLKEKSATGLTCASSRLETTCSEL